MEGTSTIEVQALYNGTVTNTRHLTDPLKKISQRKAKAIFMAGLAFIVLALATFFVSIVNIGKEASRFDKFMYQGGEAQAFQWASQSPVRDIIFCGGIALGLVLITVGLKRYSRQNLDYVIGADAHVDTPVALDYVGIRSFPLVFANDANFSIQVTPQMDGEVRGPSQPIPLAQYVQQRGSSFSLRDEETLELKCGAISFLIHKTTQPPTIPFAFFPRLWREQGYLVGTAVSMAGFLLMLFSIPPDPKSLSLERFNPDQRFINFLIRPLEEKAESIPDWLKKNGADEQGGKGKRHIGQEGAMGKKSSKNKEGLYALQGPKDQPDPHLAKKLAEEKVKNAGILGVLKMNEGSLLASIFGRDSASGQDQNNILGGLTGNEIGEAYGVGGLGLIGTGSGGGGTGEGTLGLGNFGTFGKGGGGGNGSGYGHSIGGLGHRRARTPDVIPGVLNVRGSLDREIIRRIIRRHINEVKYCYEQELPKKPSLNGRIVVQFMIAATGQVLTSMLQSSTMDNIQVSACVVQAVKRWEFPKPMGGGMVIVSYPFNFTAGGAGE